MAGSTYSEPTRLSQEDDFHAVLGLIQQSYAYMEARIDPPSSMHSLTVDKIARQAQEQEVWAITHAIDLVACVFFSFKPHTVYIGKLAVAQSHRRQGLASILIDRAEERARNRGLKLLELESRVELTENHAAFATLGFKKVSESAHDGYSRPTAITMQKQLKD